jgi:hypothetical protein
MPTQKQAETPKAIKRTVRSHEDKHDALNKARRQAWNKGLVKFSTEIPPELYVKIEALAKETGISPSQAFGILLTEQVKKWQEEEERIRDIIDNALEKAFEKEYQELIAPLEIELNDHQLKAGGFKSFRRTQPPTERENG